MYYHAVDMILYNVTHSTLSGATCGDQSFAYVCVCQPGYYGENCDLDVDECASAPCINAANCLDSGELRTVAINAYRCACLSGFSGDRCQSNDRNICTEQMDDCDPDFASCNHVYGSNNASYTCACFTGFKTVCFVPPPLAQWP
jgi:hypothetical protein